MWKKSLAVKIIIWICVVFMVISLVGVYVVYMFTPSQSWEEINQETQVETWSIEWDVSANGWAEEIVVVPENFDPENPDYSDAPVLVTEDGELNEMDQSFEVQLENWETELIKQSDLNDMIQIN